MLASTTLCFLTFCCCIVNPFDLLTFKFCYSSGLLVWCGQWGSIRALDCFNRAFKCFIKVFLFFQLFWADHSRHFSESGPCLTIEEWKKRVWLLYTGFLCYQILGRGGSYGLIRCIKLPVNFCSPKLKILLDLVLFCNL